MKWIWLWILVMLNWHRSEDRRHWVTEWAYENGLRDSDKLTIMILVGLLVWWLLYVLAGAAIIIVFLEWLWF